MKRYALDVIGRHYGRIRKEEKTTFAVLMELICFLRKFKFRIYYLEFGHETYNYCHFFVCKLLYQKI